MDVTLYKICLCGNKFSYNPKVKVLVCPKCGQEYKALIREVE